MTERRDIGSRLENWARWATARGPRGASSLTGAICDNMRRSALGNASSGQQARSSIEASDAARIQLALPDISIDHCKLLNWCYIQQARPEVIARKCGFPVKEFVERFRAAQAAIECAVTDNERKQG